MVAKGSRLILTEVAKFEGGAVMLLEWGSGFEKTGSEAISYVNRRVKLHGGGLQSL